MMGWYHDGGGYGAGDWIAMIVMMVLFWGVVVAAGVLIFRGLSGTPRGGTAALHGPAPDGAASSGRRALDILDERFARGEIDRDEYEARRSALLDRE